MNETPPYLRDLHRLPLADLARIGASCGTCAGKGYAWQNRAEYADVMIVGAFHGPQTGGTVVSRHERWRESCKPCAGTGRHGGHLRTIPDNALIALCATLAREVWAGDDPLATAQDRALSLVSDTVLPRRAGRVFFGRLPLSRFPAKALRLIGNDPRDSPIERRVARHALACRSLFGTLLAEASRRRLLPAQPDLQVAWDARLARGQVAPDADRELLLAEAWAACALDPEDRREAETAASGWLERLQAVITAAFVRVFGTSGPESTALNVAIGGETYTATFTDDLTSAADIARAINESGVPATARVEGDLRVLTVHEDAHSHASITLAPSRRPEAREPVGAPPHRPIGRALSRRLEGSSRRT